MKLSAEAEARIRKQCEGLTHVQILEEIKSMTDPEKILFEGLLDEMYKWSCVLILTVNLMTEIMEAKMIAAA